MVVFTWLTLSNLEKLNLRFLEKYESGIIGGLLCTLGLLIILVDHYTDEQPPTYPATITVADTLTPARRPRHAPASFGTAFAIGITLNLGFVILEFAYGFSPIRSRSSRMPAITWAMSWDCYWPGPLRSWRAPRRQSATPTDLRSSSILAALFNAIFLLITVGAIAWEAIRRFGDPAPVAPYGYLDFRHVGICINGHRSDVYVGTET